MAQIKRSDEAAEHYQKGVNLTNIDRNHKKAIDEFSEVLKLLPNDNDTFEHRSEEIAKDEIYYWRGKCYELTDQPEKALDDYSKAISINPKNDGHYSSRAGIYLALGETEKAKADFEKAVGMNQKDAAKYYCQFGMALEESTGNKKEAAVYLKKSVELGDWAGGMAKGFLDKWGM